LRRAPCARLRPARLGASAADRLPPAIQACHSGPWDCGGSGKPVTARHRWSTPFSPVAWRSSRWREQQRWGTPCAPPSRFRHSVRRRGPPARCRRRIERLPRARPVTHQRDPTAPTRPSRLQPRGAPVWPSTTPRSHTDRRTLGLRPRAVARAHLAAPARRGSRDGSGPRLAPPVHVVHACGDLNQPSREVRGVLR
jgi:hypothetical protein